MAGLHRRGSCLTRMLSGRAGLAYSGQRRKMSAPLVPPKPKELDSATSILRSLRLIGNVVQVAGWIGIVEIGGGRNDLALQGHDGDARLQPARAAQQMAGHRLGRTHQEFAAGRVFAEKRLDGRGLQRIAQRSGGGMGIDIVHLSRAPASRCAGHFSSPADSLLPWAPCW